ncbi:cyclin-dependent kinase inhibitor 1C-like [Sinocyclocheilus grahami]|uniref:cyclin-dependent kinase inhibitor 1C-like n=1 Tax=Sinocyclocheilus grahami TaxID=75366 RepID=UPI0007ACF198|nr:PREDICTED: cyclin-dependent kinase inhibitor 1C-like [Sinocyclocheilus grahami]
MNRWPAILHDYQAMRRLVGNCPALRGRTRIQLFEVNQRTLSVWYNNYRKKLEADVLALSVPLPQISMVSHTQLPAARQMTSMPSAPGSSLQPFPYVENPDLSGQATRRGQRPPPPASATPALSAPRAASLSAPLAASLSAPWPASLSAPPAAALSAPAAGTSMSRTTLWRKRKAAECLAQEQGLPRPQQPARKDYTCTRCGQPRKKEFGHTRVGSFYFCATAEGKTLEEWLHEKRNEGNP